MYEMYVSILSGCRVKLIQKVHGAWRLLESTRSALNHSFLGQSCLSYVALSSAGIVFSWYLTEEFNCFWKNDHESAPLLRSI